MMLRIRFLLLLFGMLNAGFSQKIHDFSGVKEFDVAKPDYLSVQTGFIVDGYNSLGVRTFFEYQKYIKGDWLFGVSYEHSRNLGFFMTDQLYELDSDLSQLSVNGYYKFNLIEDRMFWIGGFGIGALHVNWDDKDDFGATVNASLTLNVRITKRLYIETAPLFVFLPSNRAYYSPVSIEQFHNFYAFTFFPVGIKVKL
ncbi:MAG: hypothetical protein PF489_11290 [Salinivirgaceae bacterium]|jgi:hypothetical protein|nr:hypothetical protein [Salinivirgaceae bacterium]